MEVPDGWASDESEVSEVSDGGRGSGFFLDHPVDHPGALTETAFARAAGRASLAGATEVEIAFDAFERVHPDALRACAGSLTHLGLMHNGLRAFPALRHVSRTLRKLELTHQRLDSTAGLADAGAMPALRELLLNDNAIARIEGMDACPNLERLWLFSNRIERVEGLDALASLRELWLQDNDVAFDDDDGDDVASGSGERKASAGFAPLLRVREVALAGNKRLVDLETCLAAVACLPTLESLSFRDEHFAPAPVAEQPGYRERAARKLRRLRVLDAAEVTVAERGAAADDRARARCLGDADSEREREAHEAKVAELREARDRRLAAAAAARARAQAALNAVEKATMLGRATVRAHAEEAARRREARRSVLRETLLRIGESHARVSNAILARGEAAARREGARFERERRRVRFERDAARAYEALSLESDAASSRVSPTRRKDAFPLGAVLVEVREGSPEHAAVTSTARAAARRAGGREGETRRGGKTKKSAADDAVGDARVLSVWRVVAPDASSDASSKRATTSLDVGREKNGNAEPTGSAADGAEDGDAAASGFRERWGYVGLAPAATLRALGASGLDASVRAHRTLAEAYEAAKHALASGARAKPLGVGGAASEEEEALLASELDGPAALLACEVRLTREEAVLWDASPRTKTKVGFDVERERIARCAFVVHAERARASDSDDESDSDADEDAKNTPRVFAGVARRALRLTRRDVPAWFTRDDAAALRALEDAADTATREYLHDAWTALDPATGAALAAQDDELASLRGELREVRARIAEERLAQDDAARSLRKVTFVPGEVTRRNEKEREATRSDVRVVEYEHEPRR